MELRLADEKRNAVKVGDEIYFIKNSHTPQILKTKVTAIDRFDSFESAYDALDHASIGFRDVGIMEYMEKMFELYPEEEEEGKAVLAFHLEVCEE